MQVIRYEAALRSVWDDAVTASGNATFLFYRDYMEYHRDRFEDASLLFFVKGKCLGLLPASLHGRQVRSHGGLTYGGLLKSPQVGYTFTAAMLDAAAEYYTRELAAESLLYKPLPYIYTAYPAQEDLYWLFSRQATLVSRGLSATIDLDHPLPLSKLRRRKTARALRSGVAVRRGQGDDDWRLFWDILTEVLATRHGCSPVHSLSEIRALKKAFPERISLHLACVDHRPVAGCVGYDTGRVMHVQYIAANAEGRNCGALDSLFEQFIEECRHEGKVFLDFGISTERNGEWLNEGLQFQKEGLGGRATCYDQYLLNWK